MVVDALIAEELLNQIKMLEVSFAGSTHQAGAFMPVQAFVLQIVFIPDVVRKNRKWLITGGDMVLSRIDFC